MPAPDPLAPVYEPDVLDRIDGVLAELEGPGRGLAPEPESGLETTADGAPGEGHRDRAARGGMRGGLAAAALAGAMFGLAEVLDPEPDRPEIVEFAPDDQPWAGAPIEVVLVAGFPRRSRIIVRPWLQA